MKYLKLVLLFASTVLFDVVQANEIIFVQTPAVIGESAPINEKVRNECAVDALLSKNVQSSVTKYNENYSVQAAINQESTGDSLFIYLTIINVKGIGGGAWTGSKAMTISVDAKQGAKLLATNIFTRSSKGGMFGATSGTCSILENVTEALGKDVAKWLAKSLPAKDIRDDSATQN